MSVLGPNNGYYAAGNVIEWQSFLSSESSPSTYDEVGSGGIWCNGNARISVTYNIVVTGGVWCNGSATKNKLIKTSMLPVADLPKACFK